MPEPQNNNRKFRILSFLVLFLFIFFLIFARLFVLQILHHREYKEKSEKQRIHFIRLAADRGDILDRRGELLATTLDSYSIYALLPKIKDKENTAVQLSKALGVNQQKIVKVLSEEVPFVWLKRGGTRALAEKVEKLELPGIEYLIEKKRYYPKGKLASQLLGFTGIDNQGLSGVELYFEKELKGREQIFTAERDLYGRAFAPPDSKALISYSGGMIVTLTIDEHLQEVAESSLRKAVTDFGGKSGSVILMDVKNGEIYAMASYPRFDPNRYYAAEPYLWRLRAITDMYEPGSTFKVITVAAGLEERVIKKDTEIYCPDTLKVGDRIIKNSHPIFGPTRKLSLGEILGQSVNTGAAQISQKLGPAKFQKYIKRFGFSALTGIDYPAETAGIVREVKDWSASDIGMLAFGQGIAVTPLQMITAVSAIANNGELVLPRILKSIESVDGSFVKGGARRSLGKVISDSTSESMRGLLEYIVKKGSGRRCRIDNFRVGGKTGTAQKPSPTGGYLEDQYVASFIGVAPLSDPRFIAMVLVDEPQGVIWGETVAAPAVKIILEEVLRYFNVAPDLVANR